MAGVALALPALLGATALRNWLLGSLHLQAPMKNPCHLPLHQTSVLLIFVMKKLELREGKDFIKAAQASTSCLPHPELSGGMLALNIEMLEWCPLHQYQRLKELSGKLSKTCLSFPLAPGRSWWSQADRAHCS